jgi:hypothetical protein
MKIDLSTVGAALCGRTQKCPKENLFDGQVFCLPAQSLLALKLQRRQAQRGSPTFIDGDLFIF